MEVTSNIRRFLGRGIHNGQVCKFESIEHPKSNETVLVKVTKVGLKTETILAGELTIDKIKEDVVGLTTLEFSNN